MVFTADLLVRAGATVPLEQLLMATELMCRMAASCLAQDCSWTDETRGGLDPRRSAPDPARVLCSLAAAVSIAGPVGRLQPAHRAAAVRTAAYGVAGLLPLCSGTTSV